MPRVLIISNECLSSTSSNGRTLRNFLIGWLKNRLAQFYIHGSVPDFEVCQNYYRITDRQALDAFLHRKNTGGVVSLCEDKKVSAEPNDVCALSILVGKGSKMMTFVYFAADKAFLEGIEAVLK